MKLLRKCVGEPLEVVETTEKYFMDCVRSFFEKGVTTERVYLNGMEFIMVVDEDGLAKQLPLNFLMPFDNPLFPVQLIVGDVLFVRNKYADIWGKEIWDYEVADVTEQDIKRVERLLDPARQSVLAMQFVGRNGK